MLRHNLTTKAAILVITTVLGTVSLGAYTQAKQTESPTLKNLEAAYNGESNAEEMYSDFAKEADKQGYKGVASLFRAAAKSEEIHKENHAKVIEAMGGTPQNKIVEPEVKSVKDNLSQAIKGESYERDEMYPKFIEQAKKENNAAAVQTFTYAVQAETQHAQLYKEALGDLDDNDWKEAKTFYVCPVSGTTTQDPKDNSCVNDKGVKQQLETIN